MAFMMHLSPLTEHAPCDYLTMGHFLLVISTFQTLSNNSHRDLRRSRSQAKWEKKRKQRRKVQSTKSSESLRLRIIITFLSRHGYARSFLETFHSRGARAEDSPSRKTRPQQSKRSVQNIADRGQASKVTLLLTCRDAQMNNLTTKLRR
jgi:hypothetical protein